MTKINSYQVIKRGKFNAFNDAMEQALKEGWQPLGGVAIIVGSEGHHVLAQAVVKYADPNCTHQNTVKSYDMAKEQLVITCTKCQINL